MPSSAGTKPPLVLTCGEPAGIGPEIAAGLARRDDLPPLVWIGDPGHLPAGTNWAEVDNLADPLPAGALCVLRHGFDGGLQAGKADPAHAKDVIAVIEKAVGLVTSGAASGMVTLPINKAALKTGAGFAFPGHTEFLAHLAGDCEVVMMLASTTIEPACRTVPATIHIPLHEVPSALTPRLLETTIRITHHALRQDFGIKKPRLAIAGLNPHAGENGVMGHEEAEIFAPVITRLREEGLLINGPLPADTMFHAPARATWDAAICAYHDQALIPIKTLDFAGGVNITLGLPFIRTSPDHGTAFDIAGKGLADPASTIAAIRMADAMAAHRTGFTS